MALIGSYVGNPDASNPTNMAAYEAALAYHTATVGRAPQSQNAFGDFVQAWTDAISNMQWTAWSWASSPTARTMIPVVGIPMVYAGGNPVPPIYADIVSGMYDSVWTGLAQAWLSNGFTTIYARIGWEMNGSWYPWSVNWLDQIGLAAWISAWNRIATVMKATPGITVKTIWNPAVATWQPMPASAFYPDPTLVDVEGLDLYSTIFPASSSSDSTPGYYDWVAPTWNPLDTLAQYLAKPGNREHEWLWPGATGWQPISNNNNWGLDEALASAIANRRPFALPECGTGINPNYPDNGLADDGDFPAFLLRELTAPGGPPIELVNIWDIDVGDGLWQFYRAPQQLSFPATLTFNPDGSVGLSMPAISTTYQPTPQPNAAAAWAAFVAGWS